MADRLARELGTSRNDAVVRLASRGAEAYERERTIAGRRDERWAAIVEASGRVEAGAFPPPDEAREAAFALRRDLFGSG